MSISDKEYLILSLLNDRHDSAYELDLIRASQNELKHDTICLWLAGLEDKGFIKSLKDTPDPSKVRVPRRRYKITLDGVRAFRDAQIT